MNKKFKIIPFIFLGLVAAVIPSTVNTKSAIAVKAEETTLQLSLNGCETWDMPNGIGAGICLILPNGTNLGYDWDAGSGVTDKYGISLYNEKGVAASSFKLENCSDRFIINRYEAYTRGGYTIDIASDAKIVLADGRQITFDKSYRFVLESMTETSGSIWTSVEPTETLTLGNVGGLHVGDHFQTTLTVTPTSATSFAVYESDNTEVATIAGNGIITAVGEGEATITAYSGLKTVSQTITVAPDSNPITGIMVDPNEITVGQYCGYSLSDVHLYAVRGGERSESIKLTEDMVSGTFNKNEIGKYTLTITYKEFETNFVVNVEELPGFALASEEPGKGFGTDKVEGGFNADFFFEAAGDNNVQWVNISDGATLANIKSHISVDGSHDHIARIANIGGRRYHLFFEDTFNPLVGNILVLEKGLCIYQYSGTVTNWEPDGNGAYYPIAELKEDIKFIYTGSGASWILYDDTKVPTDMTIDVDHKDPYVGEELQISWVIAPSGAYATPKFTSSDESKATISQDGKILALSEGNVTITAKVNEIIKTIQLNIGAAKQAECVVLTHAPNYYSVLLNSDPNEFDPEIKTYKLMYGANRYSPEFTCEAANVSLTKVDTSILGYALLDLKIKHSDNVEYNGKVNVKVYEQYEQEIDQIGIIDWYAYATFIQFTYTSSNLGNYTGGEVLNVFYEKISYKRANGTPVNIKGIWQLGKNVALFPEFMYDEKDQPRLNEENYNTPGAGNYEFGDMITIKEKTPVFKWTGDTTVIGEDDHALLPESGETIIEGYVSKESTYRFNGDIWTRFEEFEDIEVKAEEVKVKIGQTIDGGFDRFPNTATEGVFTYTSDNENVATVNSSGMITGRNAGTAHITATLTSEVDSFKVKTKSISVTVYDGVLEVKITNATSQNPYKIKAGTDLDLAKFTAEAIYGSGKKEAVDLTNATVTGYDKNKLGNQILVIKVKVNDESFTVKAVVEVVKSSSGCGGSIASTSVLLSTLSLAGLALVLFKKKKVQQY